MNAVVASIPHCMLKPNPAVVMHQIIIKILGLGWREFWADGFNRFDCLIVPVAAVSEIVVATAGITHRVVSRLSFLRYVQVPDAKQSMVCYMAFGVS